MASTRGPSSDAESRILLYQSVK